MHIRIRHCHLDNLTRHRTGNSSQCIDCHCCICVRLSYTFRPVCSFRTSLRHCCPSIRIHRRTAKSSVCTWRCFGTRPRSVDIVLVWSSRNCSHPSRHCSHCSRCREPIWICIGHLRMLLHTRRSRLFLEFQVFLDIQVFRVFPHNHLFRNHLVLGCWIPGVGCWIPGLG